MMKKKRDIYFLIFSILFSVSFIVISYYLNQKSFRSIKFNTGNLETISSMDEFRPFNKKVLQKYIKLPDALQLVKCSYGNRGLGWVIDIQFTLPDTQTPEHWLLFIAKASGVQAPKIGYYKKDYKKIPSTLKTVESIDADEWIIRINKGYLSYNLKSKGLYRYVWTNN